MEFLEKLQSINLNSFDNDGNLCNGKWSIKTQYKMHELSAFMPSVQLIVSVYYDGGLAITWGCDSSDQSAIVTELLKAKARAYDTEYSDREIKRGTAKSVWDTIK